MNKIYGVGYLGTEKNVRNNIKCYYVWLGYWICYLLNTVILKLWN